MFNNKRIKALEQRVSELEAACTMRVGEDARHLIHNTYWRWLPDERPTATAIELIQQLMDRQKLTVEAVPASPTTFTVTKS